MTHAKQQDSDALSTGRTIPRVWQLSSIQHASQQPVTEIISVNARNRPDAIAVEDLDSGTFLTYQDLDRRVEKMAAFLLSQRLEPEQLVGLCLDPGLNYAVAQLAVLRAGGAFLPLDPDFPAERLADIINDARAPIVVTQRKHAAVLATSDTMNTVVVEDIEAEVAIDVGADALPTISPTGLAYVIYTSGSTGNPKGVMIEHRGLTNMAYSEANSYRVNNDSRLLQFATVNFDAAVCDFFATWVAGGCVCVASRDSKAPGPRLASLLQRAKITHVVLTPSVLAITPHEDLPHLDCVGSAGEACTPKVFEKWSRDRRFVNSYGPTECTVCATAADNTDLAGGLNIGRPLDNVEVLLLAKSGELQVAGSPGEIALSGVQLARGYWRRPELTAERFAPHPFIEGQRIYRTGDMARYRDDGAIEYLGRTDYQMKLRGVRLEPEEIEHQLNQIDGIVMSAVTVREFGTDDQRLIAFLTAEHGAMPATSSIRKTLRKSIPDYMVPQHYMQISDMPITPSGKIDRKALDSIHTNQPVSKSNQTFHSKEEQIIAEIWVELIGSGDIGPDTNFFAAGGNSLLAAKAALAIEEQLNLEVTLGMLVNDSLSAIAAASHPGEKTTGKRGLLSRIFRL